MGVPGLWDVIQEAGYSRALLHFSVVDGFEGNRPEIRALRVGIDASLWYFHAENSTDAGSNPELRLLAFRCFRLLSAGVVPLFMFDGPQRPEQKRGSKKGKRGTHWLHKDFTRMLDCFGMEWRIAPGEAEAELAYLNKIDIIDAVITDDVDTFLFGGRTIIRNMSFSLTGNKNHPAKNKEGKDSKFHVRIFEADAIESRNNIALTRGGMILFALLCGGDYDNNKGIRNLSAGFALGLARQGYGDRLLSAYYQGPDHLRAFLPGWRRELGNELRTNTSGLLPGRKDVSLPQNFPDLTIFELYANPITSARNGVNGIDGLAMRDTGNPSLSRLAEFCEEKFDDWGGVKGVLKRFASMLYTGLVMHLLRRAVLEEDKKEKSRRIARGVNAKVTGLKRPSPANAIGMPFSLVTRYLNPAKVDRAAAAFVNRATPLVTPKPAADSPPLFTKITGEREHVDTDKLPEYKLEINPAQFVQLASSGFKGNTTEGPALSQPPAPSGSQTLAARAATFDPGKPVLVWVPALMLREVHPQLIAEYETKGAKTRASRRGAKGKEVASEPTKNDEVDEENEDDVLDLTSSPARPTGRRTKPTTTKRHAASSPVRPPPAKRPALPASSQPPPAPKPIVALPQAERIPAPATGRPRTPPREVKVKEERPVRQNSATPARPITRVAQPTVPSHIHPPLRAVPLPPPIPFPPPQHIPPPYLPHHPRTFFNVGLIETEEPPSDRHFIFSFTDPDDPDYVALDDTDWDDPDVADVDTVVDRKPPPVPPPPPEPRAEPRGEVIPPPKNPRRPPVKRTKSPALQPVPESVEEVWEQLPPSSQHRIAPTAPALPPPPPIPAPIEVATPTTPQPPARRRKQPAQQQVEDRLDIAEDLSVVNAGHSGLDQFNQMFDQVLGIVPGAQRRKPMTAAARKRLIAEILEGNSQRPPDPPPKRRRTAKTNAAPPTTTSLPTNDLPSSSTARANQASTSRAPPPVPLQTPRTGTTLSMSASQPTSSQSIAAFPGLPPLSVPSSSQPSRPASRSRPVHRLDDIVVVSSDEEEPYFAPPAPRRNPPPAPPPRTHNSTRRVTSTQPRAGPSRMPQNDFFADIERFKDLS
ncbi:hypothetical protein BDY19DRAFT_989970 [Irpex rosettiformis]|uniref:Uncharacterized protein n=1 Tax=Irpex rosettiformis TaxID=378272 RepID=A0ACB8UGB5_9APHY|nr:hypothetical protein BDY19DRAFT_989970 [Irpex rosettiformis]